MPGFVDTLVLCDTFLRTGSAGVRPGCAWWPGIVRAGGLGAVNDLLLAGTGDTADALSLAGSVVPRNNLRDAEGNDPHCWAAAAEAIADHDTTEDKGEIRCGPVARRVGRDDVAVPVKLAQPLADAVGADEVVVLDGAAHVCNLERPRRSTRRCGASSPPTRRRRPAPRADRTGRPGRKPAGPAGVLSDGMGGRWPSACTTTRSRTTSTSSAGWSRRSIRRGRA